jgi:membrane protein YdbS with pleckstrin-like domain
MTEDEAIARRRFIAISLVRLSGAVFLTLGLLTVAGRVDLPQVAGFVFVVIGLVDFLVIPVFLARKWKSRVR